MFPDPKPVPKFMAIPFQEVGLKKLILIKEQNK
jgi:hypothetical protein